jgi:hypothetical protein
MGRLKTLEKRAAWAFLGVAGEGVASQASGSWDGRIFTRKIYGLDRSLVK